MKKNFMMYATAALMLAGCAKEDKETINNGPVELRLTSGLEMQTRANTQAEQIVKGEQVYAWVDEITVPTPEEYIKAWKLEAEGNGNFQGSAQYFPESGNGVNIYALHGNFGTAFTEGTTEFQTSLTHTVAADQTPDAGAGNMTNYTKSDLLYAIEKGVTRSNITNNVKEQNLTFHHLLSKVEVALLAGKGSPDLTGATVTIENTKLKADFTPNKDADINNTDSEKAREAGAALVTLATGQNDVTPITIPTKVTTGNDFNAEHAEAIVVPQTVTVGETFIKVVLASKGVLVYKVKDTNLVFESGKKYTFNITVNLTGLTLVSSKIEDWVPIEAVEGTAEMEPDVQP